MATGWSWPEDVWRDQHPLIGRQAKFTVVYFMSHLISLKVVVDIVEKGFDAGVRMGESLHRDMVAVPLGGPITVGEDRMIFSLPAGSRKIEPATLP